MFFFAFKVGTGSQMVCKTIEICYIYHLLTESGSDVLTSLSLRQYIKALV